MARVASITTGPAWQAVQQRLPGLLVCVVIVAAASHLSGLFGGAVLLHALLLGMALHGLCVDERVTSGIELCSSQLLRCGVALLGARVTFSQMADLGAPSVAVVVAALVSTFALGIWLALRLGMARWQGVLAGGATAICGASAALAIAAVLPRGPEKERFTLLVVVAVTALSTLAMLIYPVLARGLHLSPAQAGLFLGASIHDIAQVVASGLMLSEATGTLATIVKLLRVSLLVVVVTAVSFAYRRERGAAGRVPLPPWFLGVFVLLAGFNSAGWIVPPVQALLDIGTRLLLTLAVAGLGLRVSLPSLVAAGVRPLYLLVGLTVWIGAVSLAGALALPMR